MIFFDSHLIVANWYDFVGNNGLLRLGRAFLNRCRQWGTSRGHGLTGLRLALR